MTDHETAPDVLVRARVAVPSSGLPPAEAVRRRSDVRRRRQRAGGTAAVAVAVVALAVVPWAGGMTGDDDATVATDRAGDGGEAVGVVTTEGLVFSLPDGWETTDASDPRRTCVGPAGADGCPVEVTVAADPTVGEDPLGAVTDDLEEGCRRTLAQLLRVLSKSQGDPPASTYEGRCEGEERTTTSVVLDSGTAAATTRDPALTQEARAIVASFQVPEGWRQESRVSFQEADPAPAG